MSTVQRLDLGFVNAYLVETDLGFVLVDTGVPSSWPRLEAFLKEAGCTPDRLKLVLITHGDMDHMGNARRLQAEYHVPVSNSSGGSPA